MSTATTLAIVIILSAATPAVADQEGTTAGTSHYAQPVTVFGMTLTTVDESLKAKYELGSFDRVVVTTPGSEFQRLGFTALNVGEVITLVSDVHGNVNHNLVYPYHFVENMLEVLAKPEGEDFYVCRVVLKAPDKPERRDSYRQEYIRLTETDVAGLKKLAETLPKSPW